ncbi:hypothetical protein GIB67_031605 [Kingdonia uniflora]|uniref:Uncharacterized protein n=1 Tax=Kingdonia uniflora TaxID=39325 RepID=A0A7J7LYH6_9MAGN|nr:hypothetical protein GIB67_031605 [Kingdonia uniflora]
MVYTYTPTYYSSLHDTITSLCKTIIPFSSLKKRRLPGVVAERKLSKLQTENLKWQQESFHKILNMMGLYKEGMILETEVFAFRSSLLDKLIASPADQEQPIIIRDKLLFLQELFYAKCISEEEYHCSKRPLLQRLAVQGAEIEARDVVLARQPTESLEEEWSAIDIKDEEGGLNKENLNSNNKSKHNTPMKRIKGAASMISFVTPHKSDKNKGKKGTMYPAPATKECGSFKENPFWDIPSEAKESETCSIFMSGSSEVEPVKAEKERGSTEKVKKKAFRTLFQREQKEGNGGNHNVPETEEKVSKSAKKQWGFDGLKKWKCSNPEDETASLPLGGERSDDQVCSNPCRLVRSPIGEGPDTKLIKKKIHSDGSASDFFIDKVKTINPFKNDQIEAISTRLPVDKADLKKFFPKSWCDRYGDIVLDVVKKEFKDHVGEMDTSRHDRNSQDWVAFDDYNSENYHPNLFVNNHDQTSYYNKIEGEKLT